MPSLVLGNTAPVEAKKISEFSDQIERVLRTDVGNTITTFDLSDHLTLGQQLNLVSSVFASHHSDAPPAWVESPDPVFAAAAAAQFGCPVGKPDDWTEGPQEAAQSPTEPSLPDPSFSLQ